MDLEHFLSNIPQLHTWDGGTTWNGGGFQAHHLRALRELGGDHATILETGAGNSTLAFLLAKPQRLISIAPDKNLFERILNSAARLGINTKPLEPLLERSEWALPELARSNLVLDMALIDGGHGWPTVFVDFCYIYAMLRKDGILVIDDIQLHSIKELGRLLIRDADRFELVRDLDKSLAFRKLKDEPFLPDWSDQRYIQQQSEFYAKSGAMFAL